jgi:hypothetical protein
MPDAPDPRTLERVQRLVASNKLENALAVALAAAKKRGNYAIDQARADGGTEAGRLLLVIRACVAELEGIAAALAAAGEESGE